MSDAGYGNPSIFYAAKPPSVYPDINLDNNTTNEFMVYDEVIVNNELTDGQAIISQGYASNLNEPVNPSDAATKYFVDNFSGTATPGGVDTNIQFNDGSNGFAGSNDLIFNSGTTEINGTVTNNVVSISGSTVSGVANPVLDQDAANKAYVDSKTSSFTDVELALTQEFGAIYTLTYFQLNQTIVNVDFSTIYT